MRALITAVLLLLLSSAAVAQRSHVEPPDAAPDIDVPVRHYLYGDEAIRPGYVWTSGRNEDGSHSWHQQPIDSCLWCGRPMTLKQAATDRKGLLGLVIVAGAMVTQTEIDHDLPCWRAGTCGEADPIFGHSRAQAYSVKSAVVVAQWLITSALRKGSKRYNYGGFRKWYVFPILDSSVWAATGVIDGVSKGGPR